MAIVAIGAGVVIAGYRLLGVPAALSTRAAAGVPVGPAGYDEASTVPPEVLA
jgi:hypothetical protein